MSEVHKPSTKILIIDGHPLVKLGYKSLLNDPTIQIEGAGNAQAGYLAFVREKPDIVIVSMALPDVSGFELMRRIRNTDPDANIIVFSMDDDPAFAVRAVEMGAQAYLSKLDDPRHFVQAVVNVRAGGNYISPHLATAITFSLGTIKASPEGKLTKREFEVLILLRRGDTIAKIAEDLGISSKTVSNTTSVLKQKLGAKSHSDLIRIAVDMNLS